MLAKLLCTKRKSASAPRCLRCLGATIDIVHSITRTANRSGQGGIFASMFTKGQHRGHGDHWAWRLTGNYCLWIVLLFGVTGSQVSVFLPLVVQMLHGVSPLVAGYFYVLRSLAWTAAALCTAGLEGRSVRLATRRRPHAVLWGGSAPAIVLVNWPLLLLGSCARLTGVGHRLCYAHLN